MPKSARVFYASQCLIGSLNTQLSETRIFDLSDRAGQADNRSGWAWTTSHLFSPVYSDPQATRRAQTLCERGGSFLSGALPWCCLLPLIFFLQLWKIIIYSQENTQQYKSPPWALLPCHRSITGGMIQKFLSSGKVSGWSWGNTGSYRGKPCSSKVPDAWRILRADHFKLNHEFPTFLGHFGGGRALL